LTWAPRAWLQSMQQANVAIGHARRRRWAAYRIGGALPFVGDQPRSDRRMIVMLTPLPCPHREIGNGGNAISPDRWCDGWSRGGECCELRAVLRLRCQRGGADRPARHVRRRGTGAGGCPEGDDWRSREVVRIIELTACREVDHAFIERLTPTPLRPRRTCEVSAFTAIERILASSRIRSPSRRRGVHVHTSTRVDSAPRSGVTNNCVNPCVAPMEIRREPASAWAHAVRPSLRSGFGVSSTPLTTALAGCTLSGS
jgi:hypothetical protein